MLATQAGISFAARACMGFAPFLAPVEYMGSPLLGETDFAFACRQLMLLGAHRVLLIDPVPSPRRVSDAMDLAARALRFAAEQACEPDTAVLHVPMPDTAGALSLSELAACAKAGEDAAAASLDAVLDHMGMARCRILAFRRGCR